MIEKKALYFEAGAKEVWFCDGDGRLFFFMAGAPEQTREASELCPGFPVRIDTPGA